MIHMGIYRHYKGSLYQVLGLTHDANDYGRTCVLYISLELSRAHLGPRLIVRSVDDFIEQVCDQRGDCIANDHLYHTPECLECKEHLRTVKHFDRFAYLGTVLTEEMLQ